MEKITLELSDKAFDLLNELCETEAVSWEELFEILIFSFDKLCPFHLETLDSYVDR